MEERALVYIASPLGFAQTSTEFLKKLHLVIEDAGFRIFDPWDQDYSKELAEAEMEENFSLRKRAERKVNEKIAQRNISEMQACSILLAVLDGSDVDSGTASEVGFTFSQGKKILGLRTDYRLAGDNLGSVVNLQVEYFVTHSGAFKTIARSLAEISAQLVLLAEDKEGLRVRDY